MLSLDISYDPDAEEVSLTYDNFLHLEVQRNIKGELVFSKSFDKIDDEDVYEAIKKIASIIIALKI